MKRSFLAAAAVPILLCGLRLNAANEKTKPTFFQLHQRRETQLKQYFSVRRSKAQSLKKLGELNDALYRGIIATNNLVRAVVFRNGPLALIGKDGASINFAGGSVSYHVGLWFIDKKTLQQITAKAKRTKYYLPAVLNTKITTILARPGAYGFYLNTDAGQRPKIARGAGWLKILSADGFEPRVGVMVYDLPELAVKRVLKPSNHRAIRKLYRDNRLPNPKYYRAR